MRTYYTLLGVREDATTAEIRVAYRIAIRNVHPDINPDLANSNFQTRRLNVARDTLCDEERRKKYDEKLRKFRQKKQPSCEQPIAESIPTVEILRTESSAKTNSASHSQPAPVTEPQHHENAELPNETPFEFDVNGSHKFSSKRKRKTPNSLFAFSSSVLGGVAGIIVATILIRSLLGIDLLQHFLANEAQVHPNKRTRLEANTADKSNYNKVAMDYALPATSAEVQRGGESQPTFSGTEPNETETKVEMVDLIAPFSNSTKAANSTGTIKIAKIVVPEKMVKIELGVISSRTSMKEQLGSRHAGKYGFIIVNGTKIASCGRGFADCQNCKSLPQDAGYDVTHLVRPGETLEVMHRHRQIDPALGIRIRIQTLVYVEKPAKNETEEPVGN